MDNPEGHHKQAELGTHAMMVEWYFFSILFILLLLSANTVAGDEVQEMTSGIGVFPS